MNLVARGQVARRHGLLHDVARTTSGSRSRCPGFRSDRMRRRWRRSCRSPSRRRIRAPTATSRGCSASYVRDEKVIPLEEAIRRLIGPAGDEPRARPARLPPRRHVRRRRGLRSRDDRRPRDLREAAPVRRRHEHVFVNGGQVLEGRRAHRRQTRSGGTRSGQEVSSPWKKPPGSAPVRADVAGGHLLAGSHGRVLSSDWATSAATIWSRRHSSLSRCCCQCPQPRGKRPLSPRSRGRAIQMALAGIRGARVRTLRPGHRLGTVCRRLRPIAGGMSRTMDGVDGVLPAGDVPCLANRRPPTGRYRSPAARAEHCPACSQRIHGGVSGRPTRAWKVAGGDRRCAVSYLAGGGRSRRVAGGDSGCADDELRPRIAARRAARRLTTGKALLCAGLAVAASLTKETGVIAPVLALLTCVVIGAPRERWVVAVVTLVVVMATLAVRFALVPFSGSAVPGGSRYEVKELLVRPFATLVVPLRASETTAFPWLPIALGTSVIVLLVIASFRWNRASRDFHRDCSVRHSCCSPWRQSARRSSSTATFSGHAICTRGRGMVPCVGDGGVGVAYTVIGAAAGHTGYPPCRVLVRCREHAHSTLEGCG